MFEGTSKYFWLLFLVVFIIYIVVKICLSHIFKSAKLPGWKAFIPFYNKLVLTDKLDLKRSVFFKTFIPFANLYYFNVIIKSLLDAYNINDKESILFLLVPLYKFPQLVFKNPQFTLHLYDNTERFMVDEQLLFNKEPVEETNMENPNKLLEMQMATDQVIVPTPEPVLQNQALQPGETQKPYIEAKVETPQVNNLTTTFDGKPKVCPYCNTKLAPTAKICFFCGKEV